MQKLKLFCIPHAGSSSIVFENWKRKCKNIEVFPVEMAGRGRRMHEKPYASIQEGALDIIDYIYKNINDSDKFIIMGHSLGGALTYEISKQIYIKQYKNPEFIILSAIEPPEVLKHNKKLSYLNDADFLDEIRKLNGIDDNLFYNKKLMDIFLPILKHDYHILDIYEPPRLVLPIKAVIMIGNKDSINKHCVQKWQNEFLNIIKIYEFEGDHFYIYQNVNDILEIIENI